MTGTIITPAEVRAVSVRLHSDSKRIVLAGGCFDILHAGHVLFLEQAKASGDVLFVLLESDEHIRKIKGADRPINTQSNRATVLAGLAAVDYILLLPPIIDDQTYDSLISQIKPAIIATTTGDVNRRHKDRQAGQIGATVLDVIEQLPGHSTSVMVTKLEKTHE
jgi:rfaE bifunctional protein nucleotidyltransferase chain/domain